MKMKGMRKEFLFIFTNKAENLFKSTMMVIYIEINFFIFSLKGITTENVRAENFYENTDKDDDFEQFLLS